MKCILLVFVILCLIGIASAVPTPYIHLKLDEIAGTSVTDTQGNNSGDCVNGVWEAVKYNNGLNFTGTTEQITFDSTIVINPNSTNVTITYWAKLGPEIYPAMLGDAAGYADYISWQAQYNRFNFETDTDGAMHELDYTSITETNLNFYRFEWKTNDANTHNCSLWINEVYQDSVLYNKDDFNVLYFGNGNYKDNFNGTADDWRMYNQTLTTAEATDVMNNVGDFVLNCTDEGSDGVLDNIIVICTDESSNCSCDGTDDHVQIQWGIDNATSGDTVHINASSYIIDNIVWLNYSGISIEGDGNSTIVSIKKNATDPPWDTFDPMFYINNDSITFKNIHLNGNYYTGSTKTQQLASGNNYLSLVNVKGDNAYFENVLFNNTPCDGIYVYEGSSNEPMENLTVKNSWFMEISHDGIQGKYANSLIDNNYVSITRSHYPQNSAFRLYYGTGNIFSNNIIFGDARVILMGFEMHSWNNNNISNNTFSGNSIIGSYEAGMWFSGSIVGSPSTNLDTMRDITIRNNLIHDVSDTGTQGRGIQIEGLWNNWTIDGNTIDDAQTGIEEDWTYPSGGNINITNCIISNSRVYGINGTSNLISTYNNINGSTTSDYNGISPGTGDIDQTPLYYDISNDLLYLNSTYGTWNGTGWETMGADSPCIDTGDPTSDYSNEPTPNGSRVNMGAYGNTIYASKSGAPDTKFEYYNGTGWQEGESYYYLWFTCFWWTAECANAEQSDGQATLKITNNGTASGIPKMKLNESAPAGIKIYVDDDNTFVGAVELNTTYQAVSTSLNQDTNVTLWTWAYMYGAPTWEFETYAIVE